MNEISYNTITNITSGAGVGVGNTGANHDSSGAKNYIHHNTISGCREDIKIHLNSPDTIIEYNKFIDNKRLFYYKMLLEQLLVITHSQVLVLIMVLSLN